MTEQKAERADYTHQLDDIFVRYELTTPISAEQLLTDLESLDNAHEVIYYFDMMHMWVAEKYGDEIAAHVMPEVSAVHARMPRSALGGLTYAQLQTVLDDMRIATDIPQGKLDMCLARIDMATFLAYVRDNKPLLTKKWRQINRKSVSEINALMTEPQQAVHDYGTAVFTDRDEHQFWHISFLRSLAQSEHIVYTRNNRLHLSKRGAGWLELDTAAQTTSLFRAWCEAGDWTFWNDYLYDVADVLHSEQYMMYQAILALDAHNGQVNEQSLDDICAILCGTHNAPDSFGHRSFSRVSYGLLIRPLVYFGFASPIHDPIDVFATKDFKLTTLGRWMLKKAMRDAWRRAN